MFKGSAQALTATALLAGCAAFAPASGAPCADTSKALGVSRIVEIDTAGGPLFGDMTKYAREESFLAPKEVVLTFDDGPMPWVTKSILETLDQFCTKATFFSVGQMALAYPDSVKDVLARGHTLGSHTWSHPLSLPRLSLERAKDEIDRGFAAVALAAGQPIAPFFRFPGLSDSNPLLAHLQSRAVAAFTVDVVSNDSFIASPQRLIDRVVAQTEARQGGILLFHDIKAATARALPAILAELKSRGFEVVHMRPKAPMAPLAGLEPELAPILAKSRKAPAEEHKLIPFTGLIQTSGAADSEPPVSTLSPPLRARLAALAEAGPASADDPSTRPRRRARATSGARPHAKSHTRRKREEKDAVLFGF
jgi:peptidoglycan/xylan/chitin deacetylase (PgdA/CDA1 family)